MDVGEKYRCPSPEEMNAILWRVRQERSAAMARFLRRVGAGIVRCVRGLRHADARAKAASTATPGRLQTR
ncbi:MAG: hypothetical protein EA406_10235 [Rhodospirillales bacterium]|nr:MAG: hypothetical protein EA406_10235 [Rhodospirillales bacterium]